MPTIDYNAREVGLRFMVVGTPGSGKRSLLRRLHASLSSGGAAGISDVPLGTASLLSFSFVPAEVLPIAEYRARATLAVYTGALSDVAASARALADTDALLFVADTRRGRIVETLSALRCLAAFRFLHEVPVFFFYNQWDAGEVASTQELEARMNPLHAPHCVGSAKTGEGIESLLVELTQAALAASG
jgi:tRNA U34 5-carboxymethylaminomethyl modifying GTPase MnmE/TrmE